MEWIADTGSAQDLVPGHEIQGIEDFESSQPVNMITANGPIYADRHSRTYILSIGSATEPYVLADSPSVLQQGPFGCERQRTRLEVLEGKRCSTREDSTTEFRV